MWRTVRPFETSASERDSKHIVVMSGERREAAHDVSFAKEAAAVAGCGRGQCDHDFDERRGHQLRARANDGSRVAEVLCRARVPVRIGDGAKPHW